MKNLLLQIIMPIPINSSSNNEPMTDEQVKTYIGVLIIMNIAFIMSVVYTTIKYRKEKKENKYLRYFNELFLGNNLMLLAMLNMMSCAVDGLIIIMYLGHLIGQIL